MDVQVGPATITIHFDDQVVVCEPDSKMSSTADQGFFARDTRMVSGYRLKLGRVAPVLLNSSEVSYYSSRFVFSNPELESTDGTVASGTLELILDRTVAGGVHEDYDLTNHSKTPVTVLLEVSLESDFADLFDRPACSTRDAPGDLGRGPCRSHDPLSKRGVPAGHRVPCRGVRLAHGVRKQRPVVARRA